MNMQNLMQQAQKMQKEILSAKEEINNQLFNGESQIVRVVMNGKKELVSINIDKNVGLDKDEIEILEDMIVIAINNCLKEIESFTEKKLGKYSQSMNGLL